MKNKKVNNKTELIIMVGNYIEEHYPQLVFAGSVKRNLLGIDAPEILVFNPPQIPFNKWSMKPTGYAIRLHSLGERIAKHQDEEDVLLIKCGWVIHRCNNIGDVISGLKSMYPNFYH